MGISCSKPQPVSELLWWLLAARALRAGGESRPLTLERSTPSISTVIALVRGRGNPRLDNLPKRSPDGVPRPGPAAVATAAALGKGTDELSA
jgi:hypothetical protein